MGLLGVHTLDELGPQFLWSKPGFPGTLVL